MNKPKFTRAGISKIITDAGVERTNAAAIAMAIVQAMADALIAGEAIELRGLGTLESRKRKARTAHNPRTLAPVNIPARRVIFFRPGEKLKKELNGTEELPM
jgi:nucleoid DNA-binding protein